MPASTASSSASALSSGAPASTAASAPSARRASGAAGAVPAKPQGCTNFKLRRLTRMVSRHYDAYLAGIGLKMTQYSLLSNVLALGPVRSVDLAQAMNIDASTLTRNLKPLVASGWLALNAGPDARSHFVTITEAGRAKRAEAQRLWRSAQESMNGLLGVDQVVALHALIDDSIARLQRAGLKDPEGDSDA